MFSELLGQNVELTQCRLQGGSECRFQANLSVRLYSRVCGTRCFRGTELTTMTRPWIEGRFEDGVLLTTLEQIDQLGPAGQPVADDVWNRLLCDRDDVGRGRPVRPGSVWGGGVSAQSAAVRPDDRGRHGDLQDGQPHPAAVRADGRAEIRDRHGGLHDRRRAVFRATATTWFAGSTWWCRSTCTFPAVRRGRSRCSKG